MNGPYAGLYLHIPFCRQVCPYCDFAVRTGDAARRSRFVDHLIAEIALHRGYPLEFDTVYFGGGTPSWIDPTDLVRILDAIRRDLHLGDGARVFLEANPEDVTPGRLDEWRRVGVATLSLGVQAFDPASLSFLGRRHNATAARTAIAQALACGFETVSVDLIYGLPGQSPDDWRRELDRALELQVHHLSCYQLTVHEKTRFGLLRKRGRLTELDQDTQAELFLLTHRHLNAGGMQGYEVSQFAAGPRHHSRHNLKYWDHTPYLGLGPSAHSFHERRRWWNVPRTDPYQELVAGGRRPIEGSETLEPRALALETLMTGLRTYAGVDLRRVREDLGLELLEPNRQLFEQLVRRRLLSVEDQRIVPSLGGLAVADQLAAEIEIP